jgi:hypothetical protein
MARKERYWVCKKCHRIFRRQKGQSVYHCCGQQCTAARKWPQKDYEMRQRATARDAKKRTLAAKRDSKIHGLDGRVLRVSPKTKKAFRDVRDAKRRHSFERRATEFLRLLTIDFRTCAHGKVWPIESDSGKPMDDRHECFRKASGTVGFIPVKVVDKGTIGWGVAGRYERAFLQGKHHIEIAWTKERDDRIETLLHEIIHWFNDFGPMERRNELDRHGHVFDQRIRDLAKRVGWLVL